MYRPIDLEPISREVQIVERKCVITRSVCGVSWMPTDWTPLSVAVLESLNRLSTQVGRSKENMSR